MVWLLRTIRKNGPNGTRAWTESKSFAVRTGARMNRIPDSWRRLVKHYADKWIDIGLSSGPTNTEICEEAVRRAYASFRLPAPEIIWCQSPKVLAWRRRTFRDAGKWLPDLQSQPEQRNRLWESIFRIFRREVVNEVKDEIEELVQAKIEPVKRLALNYSLQNPGRWELRDFGIYSARYLASADFFNDLLVDFESHRVSRAHSYAPATGLLSFFKNKLYPAGSLELGASNGHLPQLDDWFQISQNCSLYVAYENVFFASLKPTHISLNAEKLLHAEEGPALQYADDSKVYALYGMQVPEKLIISPRTLKMTDIDNEKDPLVRQLLAERYGLTKYWQNKQARVIHQDDFGTLFRVDREEDTPMMLVRVINSTPEPDGSFREYFLRVPPDVTTARDAVASTFGLAGHEFCPLVET